jgi:hypothetical protein
MCFSATGSFAAAGLLAGIGLGTLARNTATRTRMFATIPLIFAAQQAAEGIVWLAMIPGDNGPMQQAAVNVFLVIALMVWPIWLPLSLQRMERDPARRRALSALVAAGAIVAGYTVLLLLRWHPEAHVAGHSIRYAYAGELQPPSPAWCLAAYAIPTVLPFFIASASMSRTIGLALAGSLLAAVIVERDAPISVWCFFAALLSTLVLLAIAREQRPLSLPIASALRAPL